jgi:hypothetical protein
MDDHEYCPPYIETAEAYRNNRPLDEVDPYPSECYDYKCKDVLRVKDAVKRMSRQDIEDGGIPLLILSGLFQLGYKIDSELCPKLRGWSRREGKTIMHLAVQPPIKALHMSFLSLLSPLGIGIEMDAESEVYVRMDLSFYDFCYDTYMRALPILQDVFRSLGFSLRNIRTMYDVRKIVSSKSRTILRFIQLAHITLAEIYRQGGD